MNLPAPASIHIAGEKSGTVRGAAFTWRTPTGIAWLEASYLDPNGAGSPAFHRFDGEVRETTGAVVVQGPRGILAMFDAEATDDPDIVPADMREGFEWMKAQLAERGTTWTDEFARMTAALADELA